MEHPSLPKQPHQHAGAFPFLDACAKGNQDVFFRNSITTSCPVLLIYFLYFLTTQKINSTLKIGQKLNPML
jgi:hypothetical protein